MLVESGAQTLDPRHATLAYDFKLGHLVYAQLTASDGGDLSPRPELAESIERRSPTEYVVALRQARFSDGRPVRADDVVYTFESILDERTRSRLRLRFRDAGLARIEALDERTVRFTLAHPHAPFVADLNVGILPRPNPSAGPGENVEHPPGAGAFVPDLVDHARGFYRFRRNPHYFLGPAPLERLTVKVIRDDNSRLLALVGGSGDLAQNTVSPLLLDAVARQPGLVVRSERSAVFSYLGFHCEDPILGDVRVREAIALAIDRARIVATRLGGRAVLSTGMLPPFHWAYAPDVPRHDFDPARARRLLDEAGHPDPDGAGPRPRFTLVYKTSSNRFRVAMAQVIAAQLADVGIEVDVRPLEFATFFADVKAGNFQIFSMQIPEVAEPNTYANFYHSDYVPTREDPDRGANRVRYRSDELDRLIDAGRLEPDHEKRRAIYADVQRVLARDLPVVPLWHEDNVAVMAEGVEGYEILPTAQWTSLAKVRKRR